MSIILRYEVFADFVRVRKKKDHENSNIVTTLWKNEQVHVKFVVGKHARVIKPDGWVDLWGKNGSNLIRLPMSSYQLLDTAEYITMQETQAVTAVGRPMRPLPAETLIIASNYTRNDNRRRVVFPIASAWIDDAHLSPSMVNRYNHNLMHVWYVMESIIGNVLADIILCFIESESACSECDKKFYAGRFCEKCVCSFCDLCSQPGYRKSRRPRWNCIWCHRETTSILQQLEIWRQS